MANPYAEGLRRKYPELYDENQTPAVPGSAAQPAPGTPAPTAPPVKSQEDLLRERLQNVRSGGYNVSDRDLTRMERLNAGLAQGRQMFSEDPMIQRLEARREDLSKGYDGQELGAMRGLARSEMDANRQKAIQTLRSNLGRGGVGGARGAAIQAAADDKLQQSAGDTERKMLLDQAQMKRTGVNDLQDFLFRKKYGESAFGIANQQLGSADDAAAAARAANQGGQVGGVQGAFQNFTPAGWLGLYDNMDWGF